MLITTVMSVIGLVLALFLRNGRSAPVGAAPVLPD
jgi:preprotein translocase subunit SecG